MAARHAGRTSFTATMMSRLMMSFFGPDSRDVWPAYESLKSAYARRQTRRYSASQRMTRDLEMMIADILCLY